MAQSFKNVCHGSIIIHVTTTQKNSVYQTSQDLEIMFEEVNISTHHPVYPALYEYLSEFGFWPCHDLQ